MVDATRLRIVFFGTPEFAVPTLDALRRSAHPVVAVITQPDRPSGRGQRVSHSPVKQRAVEARIQVLQPERLKDPTFLESFAALHADLGIVAAYGKILTDAVLAAPRLGLLNVHASLLPRYRGAAPVHRAVMAGEHETGVTIMRVVKALDAGPMLAFARRPIAPDETSDRVEHDLAVIGADLLMQTIDHIARGASRETAQDDSHATYAARLTKADGIVDWSRSAEQLHNQIRGLHPWPHAFAFLGGRRIILRRSAIENHIASDAEPGTVLQAHGDALIVATGTGTLRLLEVQAEGKRPMSPRDFLAGHPASPGDRFASGQTSR